MMESKLNKIAEHFGLKGSLEPYGDGHINTTYITESRKYIVQKINTTIFSNTAGLMNNILNVTEHVRAKVVAAGGNPDRETLTVVKTVDGKPYYEDKDGDCFRVYKFVDDTDCYSIATKPELLYEEAKAFGRFQNMLNDFPAAELYETIPEFHNTRSRFNQLLQAIKENRAGRLDEVQDEVNYALSQEFMVDEIINSIAEGTVPLRVTHNDTKINNVLFDKETGKGLCVIDLDTVMPGSLLYDFGDALRAGAITGAEDEKDLSAIWFDMDAYKNFAKGFLEEMSPVLTKKEIELLPLAAKMMTYECGIRFLADYLNGDVYFRTHRPEHNLDRARTQFKLCTDIDSKLDEMKTVIGELTK